MEGNNEYSFKRRAWPFNHALFIYLRLDCPGSFLEEMEVCTVQIGREFIVDILVVVIEPASLLNR